MATQQSKKKTTSNTKNTNKSTKSASGTSKKVRTTSGGRSPAPARKVPSEGYVQLLTLLYVVVGLLLLACLLLPDLTGPWGQTLHNILRGLLGYGAYLIPVLFLVGAIFIKKDIEYHAVSYKVLFGTLLTVFTAVLFHAPVRDNPIFVKKDVWDLICAFYDCGVADMGGGVLGGLFATLLGLLGLAGILIISIPAVCLLALYFIGMTPKSLYITVLYHIYKRREKRAEYRAAAAPEKEAEQAALKEREAELEKMRRADAEARRAARGRKRAGEEDPVAKRRPDAIDENIYADPAPDGQAYDLAKKDAEAANESSTPTYTPTGELDLAAIFTNDPNAATPSLDTEYGVDAADMELSVTRQTPDGCEGPEDTAPPWETSENGFRYAEGINKISPIATHATPDGMSEIPDVVSREQIDTAVRTGNIGTDGTALHTQPGAIPHDESEDQSAAALLASLNNMYGAPSSRPPEPPPYVYPPVSLLKKDTSAGAEDASGELEANARKLTDILRSFNVRTKIVNVSRGPTITRYELQPEAGTRVRSIANLVDDIALGLAADGVRIEAPIPGKSAIGIEVPNASVATVYIRDLIDSEAFLSSQSKVTAALGKDVAGAPILLDAAKMPHLLICGATGMGKSVCINSLIVSILFKATPEEVKLILIDPKKVELNMYSGIPHLLVPVVSDPKKAAGALHWATTEMERRFTLIEDVGMRDIKGYNSITKNDPDREYLPQIVIVIDELADLMMTAPDEVEESICRLAQKARAAGMYLIIGTQRPSVDVITGLIKANIPSRIAFRVSSQMDSRVILDEVGAEKLIGRGDMLYKPVGAQKPRRVQGSFVSEEEIDNVITFLKKTAGHAEYADDVMESIEREAALCGQKRSSHAGDIDGDDGAPDDPMLKSAVELAVESGKISTSLIQRRLSLGYGRAAKLIDRMEQLGYVSPPEGQKPRTVLITKEQYMELVLKQGGVISEDF